MHLMPTMRLKSANFLKKPDCTNLPLKNLLRSGAVKIIERIAIKALPSIPEAAVAEPKEIILNDQQQNGT